MDITHALSKADVAAQKKALAGLLTTFLAPAFGAVTKRELELAAMEAMIQIGYLPAQPSVFELIQGLKVTRSRARSLLYDRELRLRTSESLDILAKEALAHPLLQNQQYAVALDIENPYLADHIRQALKELGHTSDGSFSPNLIRLTPEAAAALVEHLLSAEELDAVTKALTKAGLPDKSVKGVVIAMLKKAVSKVADKAGEALIDDAAEWLQPLLSGKINAFIGAARASGAFEAKSGKTAIAR